MNKAAAIGLETVGCCAILAGIVVETVMGADIGFVAVTGGSLLIAAGGMVYAKLIRRKGRW